MCLSLRSLFQFALVSFASTAVGAEKITVSGSSTVYPVVKDAAPAFKNANPDVDIVVGAGGSSAGIEAVATGKVQVGMASRELKDKEKSQYADLVVTTIGRDGIALVVNAKNSVSSLTKDQVQNIYTGGTTNWKDVGGQDAPVALLSLNENHGTFEVFSGYFGLEIHESGKTATFSISGVAGGTATAKLTNAHPETLAAIAINENAIGFAPVGTALKFAEKSKRVKLLTLDGHDATVENVASGDYPLQRPLNVLTKGEPTGAVKQFIEYLSGADGQVFVEKADFVTIH